jgi:hypothetical protein
VSGSDFTESPAPGNPRFAVSSRTLRGVVLMLAGPPAGAPLREWVAVVRSGLKEVR